jgi:hypothetical protein
MRANGLRSSMVTVGCPAAGSSPRSTRCNSKRWLVTATRCPAGETSSDTALPSSPPVSARGGALPSPVSSTRCSSLESSLATATRRLWSGSHDSSR